MRVLFVSNDFDGRPTSFVESQGRSLRALGVELDFFLVTRRGAAGYLRTVPELQRRIRAFRPDIIHAHYGLCGLLANLQRRVPVVTTYHGSDINDPRARRYSQLALRLSAFNIFVSQRQTALVRPGRFIVQPCGIDTTTFRPVPKAEARRRMGLEPEGLLVLFSNFFSTPEKNAPLALEAVSRIPGARLIELKGYTPEEVCLLMNASDVCLMTSVMEGSPLFIREALACERPVVSTDVGDVALQIGGLPGCFLCSNDPEELSVKITAAAYYAHIPGARDKMLRHDEAEVALRILTVYEQVVNNTRNA